MKIMLTGFEAFGDSPLNPSEIVVRKLGRQRFENASITSMLLPVDRQLGPQKLLQSLKNHTPDAVLCLGAAAGRPAIAIERVAINLLDFRIPDNKGVQITDEIVVPGAPVAYFATLPVRDIYLTILQAGIPVELSLSAGSFLCNQVFYELLHFIAVNEMKTMAGFIHIPILPEQAAQQNRSVPSMSLETSLKAIKEAIHCIINYSARQTV